MTDGVLNELDTVLDNLKMSLTSKNRDSGLLTGSQLDDPKKEVIGQIEKSKEVSVIDIYESLENTYQDLGLMLTHFNKGLKNAKDAPTVNKCIVDFLEDFYQMREILLKRALSYEDITFSYAKELKVEKDFLLHCLVKSKNAKEVIKCMSKKV